MKPKEGFVLREVGGTAMVLATGAACLDFNGMITLNESGVVLWKRLLLGATEQELVDALQSEYDVDEKTAKTDIEAFLSVMRKNQLLDE